MTDKKFYIILDTEKNSIYNKSIDSYENVKVFDDNIMLTDNNILTKLNTQIPLGNCIIEIDKFGKEISDSALMLDFDFNNISDEFKNRNGLYIFDDSYLSKDILQNIESIIDESNCHASEIQDVLDSCVILKYDSDYTNFFIEHINIDFEMVDAIKKCIDIDKVVDFIKEKYKTIHEDSVDITIVINY